MNIKSEKEFYGEELKRVALRFNADIFVWGEELISRKLIIYPKKLKDVIGYEEVKENLEPCGLVQMIPVSRTFCIVHRPW